MGLACQPKKRRVRLLLQITIVVFLARLGKENAGFFRQGLKVCLMLSSAMISNLLKVHTVRSSLICVHHVSFPSQYKEIGSMDGCICYRF
ncbi:unnamed protein product [Sphenostylis stenocarpa]|uniref:Uncharacterized protein n=1 Tax=Sphenostylis stenocarpa TaxID=92480 RepID=A0AA86VZ88_9FABA|nr:unnamed protein product [Sphenostylis stenocarpa]